MKRLRPLMTQCRRPGRPLARRRARAARVGAGLRLGQAVRAEHLALRHRHQPALLLLRRAGQVQRAAAEAGVRRDDDAERAPDAGELLDGDGVGERVEPGAALVLGIGMPRRPIGPSIADDIAGEAALMLVLVDDGLRPRARRSRGWSRAAGRAPGKGRNPWAGRVAPVPPGTGRPRPAAVGRPRAVAPCDSWAMPVRTVIERGPKGKRSVAFSLDWPGWSRGEKSAELALETLESYRERYRPIADLAGMAREFDAAGSPRGRRGQGRNRFDRLLGHLLLALLDRAGADGRGGVRARGSRSCGPAGRSSTASRRGSRRRCARARAAEGATATGSSATPSAPRARTSRSRSACGSRRRGR